MDRPGVGTVGEGLLQFHELGQVVFVEGVGLAQVAVQVQLVEPDLPGGFALFEEQHHGLHPGTGEGASGQVQYGMQVAVFQQGLADGHGGVVGIAEKGVLDDHTGLATRLQDLDEVLQEEGGGLSGLDREVLLHLGAFLATEGRIGQHHVIAVLFLNVGQVFGQGIGMDDVGRFHTVEDHVHDADDVGQRFLLLAVKCSLLKYLRLLAGKGLAAFQISEGLTKEARRAAGAVIDLVADPGGHHLDDGGDQRTGGVVFAAISPGVAHILDLVLVQVAHLVLLGVGAEAQLVDAVDHFPQVVATLDAVLELAEYLADLVLDGIGRLGTGLELPEVGEELVVDEVGEVIAGQGLVVVEFAVAAFGHGPAGPLELPVDNGRVGLAGEFGGGGAVFLQVIQVLEEEDPGGLLHIVQLASATGILVEDVVDILECLFEH